jgi:hypothetical protein
MSNNEQINRELVDACHRCLDLFESWRAGIFTRLGIAWVSDEDAPPAIIAVKAALLRAGEIRTPTTK